MGPFAPKGTDKHFDKQAAIDCLKSWQFWIFAICYFCFTNSLNAFGFFAPTIVRDLGFKGPMAQLQTVWPNVFAFFVIIGNSWHSDRTKERPLHILGGISLRVFLSRSANRRTDPSLATFRRHNARYDRLPHPRYRAELRGKIRRSILYRLYERSRHPFVRLSVTSIESCSKLIPFVLHFSQPRPSNSDSHWSDFYRSRYWRRHRYRQRCWRSRSFPLPFDRQSSLPHGKLDLFRHARSRRFDRLLPLVQAWK